MPIQLARRMNHSRKSFVREILKAGGRRDLIALAGGLPSNALIPVAEIARITQDVLATEGAAALQYCAAEGHLPLRQWVADYYRQSGLDVSHEQVIITTGSQQAFDLVGKVLLDVGDRLVVEDPTYIAALQSFGLFEPQLSAVPIDDQGMDPAALACVAQDARLVYCMPNFQNPTGGSYTPARRRQITDCLAQTNAVLIEDDPYGLLGFDGPTPPPMACHLPAQTILFGSFSKILAPGLRLGWMCAPVELVEKLIIAKQAADLCSENLGQWIIHRLLTGGNFMRYIDAARTAYARKCRLMLDAVRRHLPSVTSTIPKGGMFLWLTLPPGLDAVRFFEVALEHGVSFVPGVAFSSIGGCDRSLRVNFTRADEPQIEEGVRRMGAALKAM